MGNLDDLVPGQYQIGSLTMGVMTPFAIEAYPVGYDVTSQDYQRDLADEIQFGTDTLKPLPLQFKINVLHNKWLPNIMALSGATRSGPPWQGRGGLADLQREWNAEDVRLEWGATKPLYFMSADGVLRKFYGRPGKIAYNLTKLDGQMVYQCTAEYRRLDPYAYSHEEHLVQFQANVPKTLTFSETLGPTWVRVVFEGPAASPTINIGSQQLKVAYTVESDEAIEICSYPWQRRVINSQNVNLGPKLTGPRPYLSRLRMDFNKPLLISATHPMKFYWHDSYRVL